jgi:hypothetical protein
VVLVEVVHLWGRRADLRTPACPAWSLALGAAAVLPLLALHSGASLQAFFGEVLTFLTSGAYAYEEPLAPFLSSTEHAGYLLALVAMLGVCIAVARSKPAERRTAIGFAVAGVAAYAAAMHQHKFWSYHFIAAFCVSVFGIAWLLGELDRSAARRVAAAYGVFVGIWIALGLAARIDVASREYPGVSALLEPLMPPGARVMFFSPGMEMTREALFLGVEIAGPWTIHYRLPTYAGLRDPDARQRALRTYAGEIRSVIDRERPTVLVFAASKQALGDKTAHDLLVAEHGLLAASGYRRLDAPDLAPFHWIAYGRED